MLVVQSLDHVIDLPQPRLRQGAPGPHTMHSRTQTRRRTRISFLISLLLHCLIVLIAAFEFPHWYARLPKRTPVVTEAIKVDVHTQLFHVADAAPAISSEGATVQRPSLSRAASRSSLSAPTPQASQAQRPIRMPSEPLATAAQLPATADAPFVDRAERGWSTTPKSIGEPTETLLDTPQASNVEIKRGFSQQQKTQTAPSTDVGAGRLSAAERDAQIGGALQSIAGGIAGGESPTPVDIVFLVDASGSMEDNIRAVARHLSGMVEIFRERELDFTLGVVRFKYSALIFPQTRDYQECKRLLENIRCSGDERAYDAIVKSIQRVKFRPQVRRRFILVTDEPFKGSYKIQEVLKQCQSAGITVDVIGINHPLHKYFAAQTGGMWFPIPDS